MLLETEKDNICINQIIGQKKDSITVEEDIIVNDVKPDVLNIISTSGIVSIYKKEITDGKIKLDGTVNTYIMYLADTEDGNIRSLNTALDFSKTINIDNCKEGMDLEENVIINRFECNVINSRKISIKVFMDVESKVYSNNTVDFISNIKDSDDMQILNCKKTINSLLSKGFSKTYAKDNIAIPEENELAEIMRADIKIINKQIKISYNKVLAKADAKIEIMYLTEDNRIDTVMASIPIMGFIDIENIGEEHICDVKYKLRNFIIKPNNNDTNSIYVEAEIELSCMSYEAKDVNLIEDLYSINSDINFEKDNVCTICGKENVSNIYNINEKVNLPEISGNKVYNVHIIPVMNNQNIISGKVIYEGDISLEILYGMDNSISKKDVKIPFTFEVMSDLIDTNSQIETYIDVQNDFISVNDTDIEIKIDLEFNSSISKNEKITIINEISTEEYRQEDLYSMVIYFVKQGDTLWKIAKRFKSTIDDIVRINGIEDENKIYPRQQLYIPKYVRKNIAV